MKISLLLVSCFLVTACALGYNPTYRFNEVQVVNLTAASIRNVRVTIVDSSKTISCDEVNKNAMCADRFGYRRYPQQGIDLSWTHADGSSKSETVNPAVPVTYNPSFPLRIVMEIREDGSVKPFYEQEEPGRDGGATYF